MRQHVFAFLVAFAVWVSGNTLFGMMPASARTGGIGMGCEPRTEVVWNNQCGTHPSCAGFCSKFTFYTKRCEELSGLNCSERDGTVQYTHEKFYCSPSWGYGCTCSGTRFYYYTGWWYPYPTC
jgi:hypothetical protein